MLHFEIQMNCDWLSMFYRLSPKKKILSKMILTISLFCIAIVVMRSLARKLATALRFQIIRRYEMGLVYVCACVGDLII